MANINHCTVRDTVECEIVDVYTESSGRQWSALDTEGGCKALTAILYWHQMFGQKMCNVISYTSVTILDTEGKNHGLELFAQSSAMEKGCGALRRVSEASCEEEINMTNS